MKQPILSRRAALGSLAASMLLTTTMLPGERVSEDAHLLELGRGHEAAAAELDFAIEHGTEVVGDVLEKLGRAGAEILTIEAKTIDGMRVKARIVCWALLGDLDSANYTTPENLMALSIVRDLIRLHDPGLEHPGALRKLVENATNSATKVN